MKLNSMVSKFLTNKLVLHIVSFLALFNVIGYMVIGHYNSVLIFIVIAVLIRYFSKNMIVVLGVPLLLVNFMSLNRNSYYEGMETNDTEEANIDTEKVQNKKASKKAETTSKMEESDVDATGEPKIKSKNEDAPFEVGTGKKRDHKIDYATTIEEAYDNLNSILGKDGIKNLTNDTKRLMNQQKELAGSLKDMGPLMEQMEPMMKQMEGMMKTFGPDTLGKASEMLENLKGKKA